MNMTKSRVWTFWNDESGATAIEYALIAGILSISIVTGLMNSSKSLNGQLSNAGVQIQNNLPK